MRRINLKKASVARADTIRDINRQIVLNYIRERGPISRAEIAVETALQRSTVSLIVEELRVKGLIEETEGESTGGRPPLLLRLRASGAVAVGVDLSIDRTIVAIADLNGQVLEKIEYRTFGTEPENQAKIIGCISRLQEENPTLEGVGVSLPGLVDPNTGTVLYIPHFKWRNWELSAAIQAATGLPVVADNDANAVALAELWFGRPEVRDVRDFILVLVEKGLGTGIVFDGQIYRGLAGAAGEFGHITIGQGAPVTCAAGSSDCWEAFAAEPSALARYAGPSGISFEELVGRALSGEAAARAALTQTAHYLGIGISNLLKALSPEAVIIGGDIARAWPLIAETILASVKSNSACLEMPPTRVIPSTIQQHANLMGALSLVLAGKFATAQLA